jgi:hypothetical protein
MTDLDERAEEQREAQRRAAPRDPRDGSGAIAGGPIRRFWAALGPGVITGAADDDPSGVAT